MVYYVEELLEIKEHWSENNPDFNKKESPLGQTKEAKYDSYMKRLDELCSKLEEKIYFFIDAPEKLFEDEHVEKLDFLIENEEVQMILSCKDTFILPSEVMMEIQMVPNLGMGDVRAVARRILQFHSRDIYEEMECEILNKKSFRNPLYISSLIQRLNMMDQDELEQLHTGEEIKEYCLNIIRDLPEDLEGVAVNLLKDAIDKICQNQGSLQEALNLLAVSRNGLSMIDLQKLFEIRKENFSVLDITLLMKYLDGFFYLGEGERIEFSHKVIRQGLLQEICNPESYKEEIKEYIKSLDCLENFRMQEGMYYARITKDYELAKEIFQQAHKLESEFLFRTIKKEALEDEGEFYCRLIQREVLEDLDVRDVLFRIVAEKTDYLLKERSTIKKIAATMVKWFEERYEQQQNESDLEDLIIGYNVLGEISFELEQEDDALIYYVKIIQCINKMKEGLTQEEKWEELVCSYYQMGMIYYIKEQFERAIHYFENALDYATKWSHFCQNEENMNYLSGCYEMLGCCFIDLKQYENAMRCFEEEIEHLEEWHKKQKSPAVFSILNTCYRNIGLSFFEMRNAEVSSKCFEKAYFYLELLNETLSEEEGLANLAEYHFGMSKTFLIMDQTEKALYYAEEELACRLQLYKKQKNQSRLRALADCYHINGILLLKLDRTKEALLSYEKESECREILYEKQKSQESLRGMSECYEEIGKVLWKLRGRSEALPYLEKAIHWNEELYAERPNDYNMRSLSRSYRLVGKYKWNSCHPEEALSYFEKDVHCNEEGYRCHQNEENLRQLSISYKNLGQMIWNIKGDDSEEDLDYAKKGLKCSEEIYLRYPNERNLQEIINDYWYVSKLFKEHHRYKDALSYMEKSLKCNEELYKNCPNETNLNMLVNVYKNGFIFAIEQKYHEKAFAYAQKSMMYSEELYQSWPSEKNLQELTTAYMAVAGALKGQYRDEEVLSYFKKCMKCSEELYRRCQSKGNWTLLHGSYKGIEETLVTLGRAEEADQYRKKAAELFLVYVGKEMERKRNEYQSHATAGSRYSFVDSLVKYAQVLFESGRFTESEKYYREAIAYGKESLDIDLKSHALWPIESYIKALKGLSSCLYQAGNSKEAEECDQLACNTEKLIQDMQEESKEDFRLSGKVIRGMSLTESEIGFIIKYFLKHNSSPYSCNITLDEYGWANVDELIAMIAENQEFTMEDLERIVQKDEEQEYSFNEDKTLIRVKQGHSIPIDAKLEEKQPPEELWHGTYKGAEIVIEEQGLKPMSRLHVHLSQDKDKAIEAGKRRGEPILYLVKTGEMHRDGHKFYLSKNGVWLTKEVPAMYLHKQM